MPLKTHNLTILVASFDAYYDAWKPFAFFFARHWPDCPYPVRVITNRFRLDEGRFRELPVGEHRGWSNKLLKALESLDTDYVLYIQEDQFVLRPVSQPQFESDLAYCVAHGADSLSYRAFPGVEAGYQPIHERFGVIGRNSNHRTKADPCIWKRSSLIKLLRPNETAWDFLTVANDRSRDSYFLRYHEQSGSTVDYLPGSAIRRGLWRREGYQMCRDYGLKIEPGYRCVIGSMRGFMADVKRRYTRFFSERDLRAQPERVVAVNAYLAERLRR